MCSGSVRAAAGGGPSVSAIVKGDRSSIGVTSAMPDMAGEDALPPTITPLYERKSRLGQALTSMAEALIYVVDRPVTVFHDWMESQRAKRRIYYYHRVFQRVPDLAQCLEDDVMCKYEAEIQWKRDILVDRHIMMIMRDRFTECRTREGPNAPQSCAELLRQYEEVCKGFKSRYDYLGATGNSRTCLMKQKQRMIAERKAAKEQNAAKEE